MESRRPTRARISSSQAVRMGPLSWNSLLRLLLFAFLPLKMGSKLCDAPQGLDIETDEPPLIKGHAVCTVQRASSEPGRKSWFRRGEDETPVDSAPPRHDLTLYRCLEILPATMRSILGGGRTCDDTSESWLAFKTSSQDKSGENLICLRIIQTDKQRPKGSRKQIF